MGCDITILVEKRESGGWRYVPDLSGRALHPARNYFLFTVLGYDGYREESGYDGVATITDRVGIPQDASGSLRLALLDYDELDYFSRHGRWLTLPEIKAFDWRGHTFAPPGGDPASYADRAAGFVPGVVTRLEELAAGDDSSVRIVYFFTR